MPATATKMTAGTNQAETMSASRWIGARLRCASATICTMRASIVSRADLLGAHDEAAGAVDGAADHAASSGSFSTGIDSPVTIDSSTALRPSRTTPSTGTLSPGRTRRRSPTCDLLQRDFLVAAVVAERAARFSARD